MTFLKDAELLTIFAIVVIYFILITVIILAIGVKSPFREIEKKDMPNPPRLFASAMNYVSGNPIETVDVTLKSSCAETFDYILTYADNIPTEWAISVIKYVVQLFGTIGPEINEVLDQLDKTKSKAAIKYACETLKKLIC